MRDFIGVLKRRYEAVIAATPDEARRKAVYRENLHSLTLAHAVTAKGVLCERYPDHPLQVAVIGPTQAGKSSIVNLLVQDPVAGVSPLAGYTIHPQGFCLGVDPAGCEWLFEYFEPYERCKPQNLPRDRHDCYALARAAAAHGLALPPAIIWDTPDFDSIDAEGYRDSVLKTAGLADLIVLVVSRDKYADESVWDMMALLQPLSQPTLVVLNKVTEETEALITSSLAEKWREARSDKAPGIVTLSYHREGALAELCRDELALLFRQIKSVSGKVQRRKHSRSEQDFVKTHWSAWIAPVTAEHNALEDWRRLVDEAAAEALTLYRRDYLDHPQHYETFQHAIAELLTLLEIPGVAAVLAQARKIVTWPMRQLLRLGKGGASSLAETSNEVSILNGLGDHLLIRVAEGILEKEEMEPRQRAWWKELSQLLREGKGPLKESYRAAVFRYHGDFQGEISQAAHRLYEKLQSQPATLNSLRATRATTDAAAVALALKTGGIGLHDLVITPAMLSITSLLTEGVLGGYMGRVAAELRQRQLREVERRIFGGAGKFNLYRLPEKMQTTDKFNISQEAVKAAEAKLNQSRHGLRLL